MTGVCAGCEVYGNHLHGVCKACRRATKEALYSQIADLQQRLEETLGESESHRTDADDAEARADKAESANDSLEEMVSDAAEFIRPFAEEILPLDCTWEQHIRYSNARTVLSDLNGYG